MRFRYAITTLAAVIALGLLPGCTKKTEESTSVATPTAATASTATAALAAEQDYPNALTAEEARAISKDAYIYGYPLVDSYRIQYAYFVDKNDKSYKAPWNQIKNIPEVYTPADTAIQTPNSDTPYSFVGLDLRAEPIVIYVPEIEKKRYYSIQFIDAYTFNFAYVGSRATGNDAGNFLIAGPNWKGEKPEGIKEVIRSDTDFDMVLFRTQLFDPADIDNVKKIQAQYKVQPLSAFLGKPAPAAAPAVDWIKPLTKDEEKTSLAFFNVLNFVLGYCPTVPSEVDLMKRFAKIGVGGGKTFDPSQTFAGDQDGHRARSRRCVQGIRRSGQADGRREIDLGRCLRHPRVPEEQLPVPLGSDHRHLWQHQAGGDVPGLSRRRARQAADRRQPLHPALRQRRVPTGQGVLVADDV